MSWLDSILRRGYGTIQNNGAALPQEYVLNVIGAAITDDPTNQRTTLSITTLTPPAGTGFIHMTGGLVDSPARALNLGSSDVTGTLALSSFPNGTAAQILVTNALATSATWVSLTGDVTITAAGASTLGMIAGVALPAPSGSSVFLKYNAGALSWAAPSNLTISGTGLWYNTSGVLNTAAVVLGGDLTPGTVSGTSFPVTVTGIHGVAIPAPSGSYTLPVYEAGAITWTYPTIIGTGGLLQANTNQLELFISGFPYFQLAGALGAYSIGLASQGEIATWSLLAGSNISNFTIGTQRSSSVLSLQADYGVNVINLGGGYGLGLAATVISLTTGVLTLTLAQATSAYLSGGASVMTGAVTVQFPNNATGQVWFFDTTNVTFGGNSINFQIGTHVTSSYMSSPAVWMLVHTAAGTLHAVNLSIT